MSSQSSNLIFSLVALFVTERAVVTASAQCLDVLTHTKISSTRGYFSGPLDNDDFFGTPAYVGDLNGDGIGDLAVGARNDDDGGTDRGAVWVLFLDKYGRVDSSQKISSTSGNFSGTLDNGDNMGYDVISFGDLDGDGISDLAAGAPFDDDSGNNRGAVWILFMKANGTVKATHKISNLQGNFSGHLDDADYFGIRIGALGDLNGDNLPDIAVGASGDDDGGLNRGAVWLLFMDTNGTVKFDRKISDTAGNFTGILDNQDGFSSPCGIGDLNSDGVRDLVVGAAEDDDGGMDKGALWVLFLDTNFEVKSHQKISSLAGGFMGSLDNGDLFGAEVSSLGDIDGDGLTDLLVSTTSDDDGGSNRGAVWIVELNANGTAKNHVKISDTEDNFVGLLDNDDFSGYGITFMNDFNGDGLIDIGIGATGDDDGGGNRGAVWILSLGCLQTCGGASEPVFQTTYGGFGKDRGHEVILTDDNNLVLAGTTTSFGAGGSDFFLIKTDLQGDTIWARTYGTNIDEVGRPVSVDQSPDGGYILTGRSNTFSINTAKFFVVRTDKVGNLKWTKYVGANHNSHGQDVRITTDSGFIITGTNGYLVKLDSAGNMQWNKYYDNNSNIHWTSVRELPSVGYLVSGNTTGYGAGGRSCHLIKTDLTGNKLWEKIYDGPHEDGFHSVVIPNDDEYAFTGTYVDGNTTSSLKMMVTKVDSAGKMIWSRKYLIGNLAIRGTEMKRVGNNGYVIAGSSDNASTFKNIIWRIDNYGNTIWTRRFPGNSNDNETINSDQIILSPDNGFMFFNYINQDSTGDDAYLIKTNSCGESVCGDMPAVTTYEEIELAISDKSSTVTTFGSVSNAGAVMNVFDANDSLLCEFTPNCFLHAAFIVKNVCLGDTTLFTDMSYDSMGHNVVGWRWYFGDGDSVIGVNNTGHIYNTPGIYSAMLVVFNDDTVSCTDTAWKDVEIYDKPYPNLGSNQTLCFGDSIVLIAGPSRFKYLWSDNSFDSSLVADTTGKYWVMAKNGPCIRSDTVNLTFNLPPTIELGNDTIICQGESVTWTVIVPGATYLWNDNSALSSLTALLSGKYWVEVSQVPCIVSDTVNLIVEDSLFVDLGSDTTLCENESWSLSAFNPQASYLWSDSSTLSSFSIVMPGQYWVTLSSALNACTASDSIAVWYDSLPILDLGPDTSICIGDSIELNPGIVNATYLWSDSSALPTLMVKNDGVYTVQIDSGACRVTDEIAITTVGLPDVALKEHYHICKGDSLVLKLSNNFKYIWSNGDTLNRQVIEQDGEYWVSISNILCTNLDTFDVTSHPYPDSVSRLDFEICDVSFVLLDAENEGAVYAWSTGENSRTIEVNQPGFYTVDIISDYQCRIKSVFSVTKCREELIIPNTITPNGDSKNDTWYIKNIDQYPENNVLIFNPNGQLVFNATDYKNDWDATHNGRKLPATVYFYLLDLHDGSDLLQGTITVIRQK